MHALFFEVRPKPGHLVHYFDHVARLRPVLAQHTGLRFLDRYTALGDSEVLLSHQLWDSEEAITGWRKDQTHRKSQAAGRQVHFADYRIRVGARVLHGTEGAVTHVDAAADGPHVLALYSGAAVTAAGFIAFESVNHKGMFIALASTDSFSAAHELLDDNRRMDGLQDYAIYRISRDYGQYDRAQAPV